MDNMSHIFVQRKFTVTLDKGTWDIILNALDQFLDKESTKALGRLERQLGVK